MTAPDSSYRADLDGMRAIAVMAVVLYHLDPTLVPGGFVGVDVFFVLSGYFITRHIVEALKEQTFSLVRFFDRRIRRLLPALFFMLSATSVAAFFVLLPADFERYVLSVIAAVFSVSNFFFWDQSGYFAPDASYEPLLHTWSLAIEEQFYLLFPALLMWLWNRWTHRLGAVIAGLTILSFIYSWFATSADPDSAFYLLPSRAWELGLGVLLALGVFAAPRNLAQRNVAAALGLALVVGSIFGLDSARPFPGPWAAPPCFGTALIIWAGLASTDHRAGSIGAALAIRPMVFIGLISYSLYLWHWPVFSLAGYAFGDDKDFAFNLVLLVASFAGAIVSWRCVEQPLRRGDVIWPTIRLRYVYAATGASVAAIFGIVIVLLNGLPGRFPAIVGTVAASMEDYSPLRSACHAEGRGDWVFSDTCVFGSEAGEKVVVWGDSHGAEIAYALSEAAESGAFQFRQITASSCPPALGFSPIERPSCAQHNETMMSGLEAETPSTVLLVAFYEYWTRGVENTDAFWAGIDNSIERLRQAGHEVVLLGGVPRHPNGELVQALNLHYRKGGDLDAYRFPVDAESFDAIDARLSAMADRHQARYVPILPQLCGAKESCRGVWKDGAIYFDAHHVTVAVARRIRDEMLDSALPQ